MTREQITMDDAVEQLVQIVEEADADSLIDMYKLLCNPSAELVEDIDGTFQIIYTNED